MVCSRLVLGSLAIWLHKQNLPKKSYSLTVKDRPLTAQPITPPPCDSFRYIYREDEICLRLKAYSRQETNKKHSAHSHSSTTHMTIWISLIFIAVYDLLTFSRVKSALSCSQSFLLLGLDAISMHVFFRDICQLIGIFYACYSIIFFSTFNKKFNLFDRKRLVLKQNSQWLTREEHFFII